MLGTLLLALAAAAQAPTAADVAEVKALVAKDRSYAPAARAEAERRLAALPALVGNPPRFELEVTRIIALAVNGHTVLFPAQWTTRYPRSPLRLALFADGLFVVDAPPEHASAIGSSVTAIYGRPWREAYDAFDA